MGCIIEDTWITSILKKKSYFLDIDDSFITNSKNANSQEYKWLKEIKSKESFVTTKVPTINIRHIEFLEEHKFNLIDTNITLKKKCEKAPINLRHNIMFAKDSDKKLTMEVAQNNFVYTRFHLDYKVSNEIANSIKSAWVENYFNGKRGDKLVISKQGNEITGFLLLIERGEVFVIDLIATDKRYHKQGIAIEMIRFAEEYYYRIGKKEIVVGTQISNIPSIKLYQKLGFIFEDAKYIFHYHN